jgi:thioredoxin-like negative regulator of GroEL
MKYITAVPTVIMFDGKIEVNRFTGVQPEHKIAMIILESYE